MAGGLGGMGPVYQLASTGVQVASGGSPPMEGGTPMPGQHRDYADPPFRAAARVLVGHLLACCDALCGLWRPRRRWPSSSGRRDVQAAVALVVGAVLAAGLSLLFTVGTAPAAAPAPVPRPRPTVTVTYPVWKLPPGWPAGVPGARPRVSGPGS